MNTKRTNRNLLHRIALGAAIAVIAAILVPMAGAKPLPASDGGADVITLGPGEIPQVASVRLAPGEIPYLDYGTSGSAAGTGVADDGIGMGVVSSAVVLFLLAGGIVVVRQSRRAKLSPA